MRAYLLVAAVLLVFVPVPALAQDDTSRTDPAKADTAPADTPADSPAGDEAPGSTTPRASDADHHIFGVLPNYATVENPNAVTAVASRQKFHMAAMNTFDPFVYPFVGVVALISRSYGAGVTGYGKQYAASLTDNISGNFLTTAVLPSLLRQDPRYYERGTGTVLQRIVYAASRSAITHSDSGRAEMNVSELGGTAIAAGLSNAYYPEDKQTLPSTLSRWGMQLTWDTLSNELKEFWPDVHRLLHHP